MGGIPRDQKIFPNAPLIGEETTEMAVVGFASDMAVGRVLERMCAGHEGFGRLQTLHRVLAYSRWTKKREIAWSNPAAGPHEGKRVGRAIKGQLLRHGKRKGGSWPQLRILLLRGT